MSCLPVSIFWGNAMESLQSKAEVVHLERDKGTSRDDAVDKIAEAGGRGEFDEGEEISDTRLDRHGLPLVPQPTGRKDDPLVSPPIEVW
jgi:hypothetical protein